MPVAPENQTTGLVLAGGRGSRMGGVDKGLQLLRDEPLALHVLRRLAPQTDAMLISANRSGDDYARLAMRFDARVIADSLADYPGPLAGIATALRAAHTEFVLTAPCDAPFVDPQLGTTLRRALDEHGADIAYAATVDTDETRIAHPVFALIRTSLADDLDAWLAAGERKVRAWYARHKAVQVPFHDDRAFYNINDLYQLAELARR
ncbi:MULTISPECIES: molybdenum cofactor guanylyltransferase MobA [unclassified Caballeronia]|uniref:molybdenum cofactor guanylyltransferase MobA n=1 Tax=unclassified Caballeronia TaxID=2646786 RepID=UPI002027E324|nr:MULTISPECIES: molybdenum cofactor guanylyltransferase MobA [unclassified Caballeronia]MDR5804374.1 molybdenum cofactor guanylyltransferase MobA [Caballeronia sp. LZ001]